MKVCNAFKILKKYKCVSFVYFGLLIFLTSCSLSYKGMGKLMHGYAEDEAVPYMLTTDDFMMGCSMSEAFTPFLLSFSRVISSSDKLAILFYMMNGNCTELAAWEEELRYLRAIYTKNALDAQDARIASQRLLILTVRRQLKSYYSLFTAFIEPGGDCPEFSSTQDELYWLTGLISGLKAILNDIASSSSIGVPMDIAAKIRRSSACLNNEKWWGIPQAIQAAIKIIMPGSDAIKEDAMVELNHASLLGEKTGISVANVLAVQIYLNLGEIDKVKRIIRSLSKLKAKTATSREFKIFNQLATLQLLFISDQLWIQATGSRTPLGKLGTFWDDPQPSTESIDIDELL